MTFLSPGTLLLPGDLLTPGIDQVAAAAAPLEVDHKLGCGVARAEIWTRGGGARVVDLPGVNAAEWDRMLSDTSQGAVKLDAQAVSSNAECCELLQSVEAWEHELHVYRDGAREWLGAITEIELDGSTLTIKARDLSVWYDRRFVHSTHIYGGQGVGQGDTDTSIIFSDLVTDAMAPDTSPNITLAPGQVSGVFAQGNYTPGAFLTVGPLIRDLAKGSIDWHVIRRTLAFAGGGASTPAAGGGLDVTALCVANPGAEVNTSNWSVTGAGWSLSRDTGVFRSGVASLKATNASNPPVVEVITQPLSSLIVGKTYTVEVWLRAGTLSSGWWTLGSKLKVKCAGIASADVFYSMAATSTVFVKSSVTFKATATSHNLDIDANPGFGGGRSGFMSLYVDDVRLVLNDPDVVPAGAASPTAPSIYLTDDSLAAPPKIRKSGMDQETRSVVTMQQTGSDVAGYGEAPLPAWALNTTGPGLTADQSKYGLLEQGVSMPLADASSAGAQAAQRSAILSTAPIVIDTLVLSKDAGVTMSELVPGILVDVRLDRTCIRVRKVMLLRQVKVAATPSGETVTLTLEPSVVV